MRIRITRRDKTFGSKEDNDIEIVAPRTMLVPQAFYADRGTVSRVLYGSVYLLLGVKQRENGPLTVENEIATTFAGTLAWDTAINNRGQVPMSIVIYALCTANDFPRLSGNTNILYIGSTVLLGGATDRARLYSYRYSPQSQPKDIRDRVSAVQVAGNNVSLKWRVMNSKIEARTNETRLLSEYKAQHLECPPFNGKG